MWKCGDCREVTRRADMFMSELTSIADDEGSHVTDDFGENVYRDLMELYTTSGDWIVNIEVSSGEHMNDILIRYHIVTMTNSMVQGNDMQP